nr:hypothetical protein [uncultured Cohaesibacter sp.]
MKSSIECSSAGAIAEIEFARAATAGFLSLARVMANKGRGQKVHFRVGGFARAMSASAASFRRLADLSDAAKQKSPSDDGLNSLLSGL